MGDLKKTKFPGYMKDMEHNVVINTDTRQYEEYLRQVSKSKQFQNMKKELSELKTIVAQLIKDKST